MNKKLKITKKQPKKSKQQKKIQNYKKKKKKKLCNIWWSIICIFSLTGKLENVLQLGTENDCMILLDNTQEIKLSSPQTYNTEWGGTSTDEIWNEIFQQAGRRSNWLSNKRRNKLIKIKSGNRGGGSNRQLKSHTGMQGMHGGSRREQRLKPWSCKPVQICCLFQKPT